LHLVTFFPPSPNLKSFAGPGRQTIKSCKVVREQAKSLRELWLKSFDLARMAGGHEMAEMWPAIDEARSLSALRETL